MRRVYLDNNATSPLLPEVFDAMRPCFFENFGNASSIHQQGQQARATVEQARDSVAQLLGARAAEIVFTSGGTEGDNLALLGMVSAGDHIVTSSIEHHAVLNSCKRLEALGVETTFLPVDGQGLVNPDDVRSALRPNTRLISVMMANNETGALQPVEEIGRIAAEADVWFHTDAVQAAGKVAIDVGRIGCDLLTISAHKLHGPQGVGALYVRKGTLLQPMMHGGRHERGKTRRDGKPAGHRRTRQGGRDWLASGLPAAGRRKWRRCATASKTDILRQVELTRANSGRVARTPNTSNIIFECIEGEALVIALDLKGISVSTGAACSSGAVEPSHVLTAMGLTPGEARASIRFSLGKQTSEDDLEFVLEQLPATVTKLRELSPLWSGSKARQSVGG